MATTMLDALPYLIDYPYGCTEQTMSRFLPAVILLALRDLGLKPETAMNKIFGGIEAASAAATHPAGRRDLQELDRITKAGLERLTTSTSGRRLGLVEGRRERSFHDRVRRLGHDARAPGGHRCEVGFA